MKSCSVCELHEDAEVRHRYEISRNSLWVLRHHPDPAPLTGWLLLDTRRHMGGPMHFTPAEAGAWGPAVQQASQLVQQLTGCDRVYAIAFGEGARHLHLHLIPRFAKQASSEAWKLADLYRAVAGGERHAAEAEAVKAVVQRARLTWGERWDFN